MIEWETAKKHCDRLSLFTDSDFLPLQFTGLLDSRGKEIYEGDILRSAFLDYEIVWIANDYHTGFRKKSGDNFTDIGIMASCDLEIIGNIFENGDLLNENR